MTLDFVTRACAALIAVVVCGAGAADARGRAEGIEAKRAAVGGSAKVRRIERSAEADAPALQERIDALQALAQFQGPERDPAALGRTPSRPTLALPRPGALPKPEDPFRLGDGAAGLGSPGKRPTERLPAGFGENPITGKHEPLRDWSQLATDPKRGLQRHASDLLGDGPKPADAETARRRPGGYVDPRLAEDDEIDNCSITGIGNGPECDLGEEDDPDLVPPPKKKKKKKKRKKQQTTPCPDCAEVRALTPEQQQLFEWQTVIRKNAQISDPGDPDPVAIHPDRLPQKPDADRIRNDALAPLILVEGDEVVPVVESEPAGTSPVPDVGIDGPNGGDGGDPVP